MTDWNGEKKRDTFILLKKAKLVSSRIKAA